jgi:4a-hydroxytetrahydrobiopterin dehydratase
MAKLSSEEITAQLKELPGWEYKDGVITKLYRFKEFMHGIEFVAAIANLADAADHHPDIAINYTRVRFSCVTHSEGGVTEKDSKLAREIEAAFTARAG